MPSNRINGTKLYLKFGTTDVSADLTAYNITHEDADQSVVTFADAAAGGKFQAKLSGTAIQSLDTASFWSYVWANVGQTVPFVIGANGQSSGTANNPVISGTTKIARRPDFGGEANVKGQDFVFDFEWDAFDVIKTP